MNNEQFVVHTGDNLPILLEMPDNSVDAIVTDPPYGLSFMGKRWDYDVPLVELWVECLRVLKPGGHLLAFAGTRTQHRMAVRIEDAGFEIRDMIAWVYGSGFPKSLDVSKAIDKAAGAEREVVSQWRTGFSGTLGGKAALGGLNGAADVRTITTAATDAAKQWDGWGTALKPALEPITLARKPLAERTVAANVLEWGTGGVNVDGCRVGTEATFRTSNAGTNGEGWGMGKSFNVNGSAAGRFPANLIHDGSDEVMRLFPVTTSGSGDKRQKKPSTFNSCVNGRTLGLSTGIGGDTGSAARFFYCAKASRSEREAGLEVTQEWLDALELVWHNDTVSNLSEVLLWEEAGQNQNTDWSGAVSRAKGIFEATTAQRAGSDSHMLLNGNCATGLFLKAIRCITSTKTRLTIESKTLNLLAHLSINGNTEAVIKTAMEIGLSPAESAALKSLLKAIITSGLAVFPHGVNPAAKKTPQSINAKDALMQRLTANIHSTVKPIALMRYLCRLVTPPGGIVLDPFTGSGTTGCAAMLEGFQFIGIEREEQYVEIAQKRIEYCRQVAGHVPPSAEQAQMTLLDMQDE